MFIRVFLHAEFISAMKTVQNPTIFEKNAKNGNMISFGNFCSFFEVITETLEQNIRKVIKYVFYMIKLEVIMSYCKFNKNMLIRVFLHAEFISAMKTVLNPRIFVKNAKKIEKWLVLVISVNFLRFSLKLLSRISEKS